MVSFPKTLSVVNDTFWKLTSQKLFILETKLLSVANMKPETISDGCVNHC